MTDSTFVVGAVAAAVALLGTPLLAAVGVLGFVLGSVLALVVPIGFGLVAVVAGRRVSRRRERAGIGLAVASVLATVVGVVFGVTTVF